MARDEAIKTIKKLEAKYGGLQKMGLTGFNMMSKDDYFLYIEAQRATNYFF